MWRSLVSAPALGAGGRGFESRHPDRGLPTELSVSYRQNCGGDLVVIVAGWSDTSALWVEESWLPVVVEWLAGMSVAGGGWLAAGRGGLWGGLAAWWGGAGAGWGGAARFAGVAGVS